MNIYAFDVDETLEVSAGPIQITKLRELAKEHIVGLCGNWALFVKSVGDWHTFISFVGPMEMTKEAFLEQLATHVKADSYFMVGSILDASSAGPLRVSRNCSYSIRARRCAALSACWRQRVSV
jgi:hypothetical protein